MPPALSVVDLLADLGGAEVSFRRQDDLLALAALVLPAGRQMLVIERTYRDGIQVLLDPTPEEIEIARGGNLWEIWNSERTRYLASAVPLSWQQHPAFNSDLAEPNQVDDDS